MSSKKRDGDSLTFDFFKDLFHRKPDLAAEFSCELVRATAIWLPVEVYRSCPVLLPWVVRDPDCRRSLSKNRPEQWGSPCPDGYFRDDNSMVKGLVKAVPVRGPKGSAMNGRRIRNGWVASHVWRSHTGSRKSTNTDPELNTFLPNLVWLPRQIAKLSDQDHGPVQTALKQISQSIYKRIEVEPQFAPIVQSAWKKLPPAGAGCEVDLEELYWFDVPEDFVSKRKQSARRVVDAIDRIEHNEPIRPWRVCHRYLEGLPQRELGKLRSLSRRLKPHAGL
jgi:hypothetical protein